MASPFSNAFSKGKGNTLLSSDLSDGANQPNFSLMLESLDDGANAINPQNGGGFFDPNHDESPINPPENSAQAWERQAHDILNLQKDLFGPDKLTLEKTNPNGGRYLHLYNQLINGDNTSSPVEAKQPTWEGFKTAEDLSKPVGVWTHNMMDVAHPDQSSGDQFTYNAKNRQALRDDLGMSGNDYFNNFHRIDARAKPSPLNYAI